MTDRLLGIYIYIHELGFAARRLEYLQETPSPQIKKQHVLKRKARRGNQLGKGSRKA